MTTIGNLPTETKRTARVAGALYFLSAVAADVPAIYIPGSLIVDGSAAATGKNVLASEMLFRASMAGELCGAILLLSVAALLYRLLHRSSESSAALMVAFVLVSVPITFVNVLNESAALALFHGGTLAPVFSRSQSDALAMLFLDVHGDGVALANIFWGLWLFRSESSSSNRPRCRAFSAYYSWSMAARCCSSA